MIAEYIEDCKSAQVEVLYGLTPYTYDDLVASLKMKYGQKGLSGVDMLRADQHIDTIRLE